jgi:hypothetical protein
MIKKSILLAETPPDPTTKDVERRDCTGREVDGEIQENSH